MTERASPTLMDTRHVVFPVHRPTDRHGTVVERLDDIDRHLSIHKHGLRRNRAVIEAIRRRIADVGGLP